MPTFAPDGAGGHSTTPVRFFPLTNNRQQVRYIRCQISVELRYTVLLEVGIPAVRPAGSIPPPRSSLIGSAPRMSMNATRLFSVAIDQLTNTGCPHVMGIRALTSMRPTPHRGEVCKDAGLQPVPVERVGKLEL
jgi:hypothetical protein